MVHETFRNRFLQGIGAETGWGLQAQPPTPAGSLADRMEAGVLNAICDELPPGGWGEQQLAQGFP